MTKKAVVEVLIGTKLAIEETDYSCPFDKVLASNGFTGVVTKITLNKEIKTPPFSHRREGEVTVTDPQTGSELYLYAGTWITKEGGRRSKLPGRRIIRDPRNFGWRTEMHIEALG